MKLKLFCLLTAALLAVCAVLPAMAAKDPAERKIASVNGGALKLRAKASSNADILGTYATGTLVNVLDDSNKTWYHVEVNGKTGYMMAKYLEEVTTYRHQAWAIAGDGEATFTTHLYPTAREFNYTASEGVKLHIYPMKKSVTDEFVV